ncbi:MAG: hypothetical protein KME10_02475 [Plectolyngbya sp. WJT66-NPBG17]|jgi:alanine racemase|nr:hypothetical protein [Plectolyngbya sp. WJT66-NPBG17]
MNMNIQEFLQRFESKRDGEKLQHVLIGSSEGIHEVKQTLHALRYGTLGYGVRSYRCQGRVYR